ncbi:MAG: hypothetical protein ACLUKE_08655 [Blautia wexlerae]
MQWMNVIRERNPMAIFSESTASAEVIAMSIFEYDKEEEEQKLQATYEKIGEKRGEKQGELKKAKSIAISLAQEGEPVERIARTLGETEKTIKEWLAETH